MNGLPAGPGKKSPANAGNQRTEADWNRTDHINCPKGHETDIAAVGQAGVKG